MKRLLLVLSLCLIITGCDSGGGSTGGSGSRVGYAVDCNTGVRCSGVDDINEYSSGDYHSVSCIWLCSAYKGREDVYVSLTFEKNGGSCWVFDREYISGGICN